MHLGNLQAFPTIPEPRRGYAVFSGAQVDFRMCELILLSHSSVKHPTKYTHTHTHMCAHRHMHTHMCTHRHMHTHAHTHVHTQAYAHTCTHTCAHVHIYNHTHTGQGNITCTMANPFTLW